MASCWVVSVVCLCYPHCYQTKLRNIYSCALVLVSVVLMLKTKLVPSLQLRLQAVTQSLPPAVMQAPTLMISRLTKSSLMADLLALAHWLSTDSGPLCIIVTGSIARSANLPVFSLLRGRF